MKRCDSEKISQSLWNGWGLTTVTLIFRALWFWPRAGTGSIAASGWVLIFSCLSSWANHSFTLITPKLSMSTCSMSQLSSCQRFWFEGKVWFKLRTVLAWVFRSYCAFNGFTEGLFRNPSSRNRTPFWVFAFRTLRSWVGCSIESFSGGKTWWLRFLTRLPGARSVVSSNKKFRCVF